MKLDFPLRHHVPTELRANLEWRKAVQKRVLYDSEFADVIRQACVADPVFFVNGFCWTFDPRGDPFKKIPFILYDFQVRMLSEVLDSINERDLLVEKSRDMGASWVNVVAFFWCWRFLEWQSFLVGSRTDELVDSTDNSKALFWRFDFLWKNLPAWLMPKGFDPSKHRTKRHLLNPETQSCIDGETTTKDFGRGDRRTAILLDEFAMVEYFGAQICESTRAVTNSRIFNSTPNGTTNAFYTMRNSGMKVLTLDWWLHPRNAVGLYTRNGENFTEVDRDYWSKFDNSEIEMRRLEKMIVDKRVSIQDGDYRSPWFANECRRAGTAREVAKEILIDYGGSGEQFFSAVTIQEVIREFARPPTVVGDLEFDRTTSEPTKFREDVRGSIKLWCQLDGDGKPQLDGKTAAGADISAGTGASNSALAVYSKKTNEKILEIATPFIRPEGFARLVVATCLWIKNATGFAPFLIWESNGPGRQFGSVVRELKYNNFYLRADDESITHKVSDVPGVPATRKTKHDMMGKYRDAVETRRIVNRSQEALEETLEYIFGKGGGVEHAKTKGAEDSSGAEENHGDRAMADALACKGMNVRLRAKASKVKPEPPVGSLAWRIKTRKQQEKQSNQELGEGWR